MPPAGPPPPFNGAGASAAGASGAPGAPGGYGALGGVGGVGGVESAGYATFHGGVYAYNPYAFGVVTAIGQTPPGGAIAPVGAWWREKRRPA